jgi:hypothetical protein
MRACPDGSQSSKIGPVKWGLLVSACALPLLSQSVTVYSEFARIDASGEVIAPAHPREILSPAVVRNGFTSFQVVVRVPKDTAYTLYIGENPMHATKVTLYRVVGENLEPVELPYQGDSTQTFWLDLWVDGDAPVRRIKIEPQLSLSGSDAGLGWITYPMEVRVIDEKIPNVASRSEWYMKTFLCGPTAQPKLEDSPAQPFHSRNERQDIALAEKAPKPDLLRLSGGCEAPHADDPEWYLKIRDYLFRMR